MDDRAFENCVVLTPQACSGNIRNVRSEHQQSVAFGLLSRLASGNPVALVLDDRRLPKKKRAEKPVLFLTPVSVFGTVSPLLMVALQARGCEVVDTRREITAMPFIRMGISVTLSKALAVELNLVFNHRGAKHE